MTSQFIGYGKQNQASPKNICILILEAVAVLLYMAKVNLRGMGIQAANQLTFQQGDYFTLLHGFQ